MRRILFATAVALTVTGCSMNDASDGNPFGIVAGGYMRGTGGCDMLAAQAGQQPDHPTYRNWEGICTDEIRAAVASADARKKTQQGTVERTATKRR